MIDVDHSSNAEELAMSGNDDVDARDDTSGVGKSTAARDSNRTFLVVLDDSDEMSIALRFACLRARRTNGRVALLYVIEPADFQHWAGVGKLMEEEAREQAEQALQKMSANVVQWSGAMPVLHVRQGSRRDAVLQLIEDEPGISVLVLGASTGPKGPGPLVSALTGKMVGKMRVPVTIVPGNMDEERLEAVV